MISQREIEKRAEEAAGEIFDIYKKQTAGLSDKEIELLFGTAFLKFMGLLSEWDEPIDVGNSEC